MKQRISPEFSRWISPLAWGGMAAALVLWNVVPPPPEFVETYYSRAVYPWMLVSFGTLGDLVSFSLGGSVLLLAVLGCIGYTIFGYRQARRRGRTRRSCFGRFAIESVRVSIVLYLAFLLIWGANYRRLPVQNILGFDSVKVDAGAIRDLLDELIERIRRHVSAPGERDVVSAEHSLIRTMAEVLPLWLGADLRMPRHVKRTPRALFLKFGNRGMILPLFLEAHTDGALSDVGHLSTAAHELAHVAGIAGEADAEFLGLAAALHAPDHLTKYAVELAIFVRCIGDVPKKERQKFYARLPQVSRNDIRKMREIAREHYNENLGRLQRISFHSFLESQGVKSGVHDYDRSVKLFARAHRSGRLWPSEKVEH